MDTEELYKSCLKDIKLMQLATCSDNQPWLCNVWYVIDATNKIYWISRETRRHSEEIAKNPKVSCTFHQWFDEGLGQKGKALTIAGNARQLTPMEVTQPYQLYLKRYPKLANLQSLEASKDGSGDHKFYEVTPTEIIWWDEESFPHNSRQKIL
jgi:uncharacterized pyridoxamine 5'-phosphate oxidase family protein